MRTLLLAALLVVLPSAKYPVYFGAQPEEVTFRWLPGAAVHSCMDVEEHPEITCAPIDWIRDAKNKHHWIAVCGR